ncbi:hypothetical protein ACFLYR_05985 [Chloroflexota bacterium]
MAVVYSREIDGKILTLAPSGGTYGQNAFSSTFVLMDEEVWNYGRGDGLEKCVLIANILHSRMPDEEMAIEVYPDSACLKVGQDAYDFSSRKALKEQFWPLSTKES